MPKHDYSNRTYVVEPYDPNWPKEFQKIRDTIAPLFASVAERIEHVGSTSVPGMVGKPTIDVLVIVKDINAVDALSARMVDLGYKALGEYVSPGGRLFALDKNGDRWVNIHCFPVDHQKTDSFLYVRDYLLTHPEDSHAYTELKERLFKQYPKDYGAYRIEKDVYVKELEQRAKIWWLSPTS